MFCHIFSESNRVDVNAENLKLYLSNGFNPTEKKTTERGINYPANWDIMVSILAQAHGRACASWSSFWFHLQIQKARPHLWKQKKSRFSKLTSYRD